MRGARTCGGPGSKVAREQCCKVAGGPQLRGARSCGGPALAGGPHLRGARTCGGPGSNVARLVVVGYLAAKLRLQELDK